MYIPNFRMPDYAGSILKAEQVNAMRRENDPNSLKNQYLAAKIAQAKTGSNEGLTMAPISFKDATAESIAAAIKANDPSLLERVPYKPYTVDTKTHRIFYDIDPITRDSREIDRIPIENFTAAYDAEAGKAAVAEGIPNPRANTAITPEDIDLPVSGPEVARPAQPYIPRSAAELAADRVTAEEEARAGVKRKVAQVENDKIWNQYDAAIKNVNIAMENAFTAPGMALLPAATAGQRIAEGSVATLRPILKSAFRAAGEGTFTDRDQALLDAMLPTRNDSKEVRLVKIGMLNQVMAAKLGQSEAMPEWYQSALMSAPKDVNSKWFDNFLGQMDSGGSEETYEQRRARLLGQ